MNVSLQSSRPTSRLLYIDNLRWSLILLVLFVHSSIVYGALGSWPYHDPMVGDPMFATILTIIDALIQSFFMGLLFLLGGYFAPFSLDRKGPIRFIKDRFVRLGIPTLIYVFILAPMIIYPLDFSYKETFMTFFSSYFTTPAHWDTGPLWFALALLVFSVLYALVPKNRITSHEVS